MKPLSFSAANLLTTLEALPLSGTWYVAYSGGLDSHVLLHALSSIRSELSAEIHALHVNHGLNDAADAWVTHCENTCKILRVDITVLNIGEPCPQGESREAWARQKRYQLLAIQVASAGVLLTAHHQNDQAETVLLQMTRGAGLKGLAAMPLLMQRDKIWHARPLLNVSRQQLLKYAKTHNLQWTEDDSNADSAYDRNFFRQEILPKLEQRWPNITATLTRVAAHQAEAILLLDDLAEADLRECVDEYGQRLHVEKVSNLSSARQTNVIRYWLRQLELPVPDTRLMQEILNKLLPARSDASPLISWPGVEFRRYQNHLYAFKPLASHDEEHIENWHLDSSCHLGDDVLSASLGPGTGIKTSICPDKQLQVRFRRGGEKIQLSNKEHRQELKKLFQEKGIPPWIRDRIPLFYIDEKLIAVAGLWIAGEACSRKDKSSWQIHWTGLDRSELKHINKDLEGNSDFQ